MTIPEDVRAAMRQALEFCAGDYCMTGDRYDHFEAALAWLDAQPAAPEPDWDSAPEWANWWAASVPVGLYKFTNAFWYAEKPHMRAHEWVCATNPDGSPTGKMMGAPYVDLPLGIDWRTTLRRRPEVTE